MLFFKKKKCCVSTYFFWWLYNTSFSLFDSAFKYLIWYFKFGRVISCFFFRCFGFGAHFFSFSLTFIQFLFFVNFFFAVIFFLHSGLGFHVFLSRQCQSSSSFSFFFPFCEFSDNDFFLLETSTRKDCVYNSSVNHLNDIWMISLMSLC